MAFGKPIEEKKEILKKVDALVAGGDSVSRAVKKEGISSPTYYAWKRAEGKGPRVKRKKKGPRLLPLLPVEAPSSSARPLIAFIGSLEQVVQAVRSLQ